MKIKIGAAESDAALAMTFFLTILVNISLPILFTSFFCYETVQKGCPDWRKFDLGVLRH